MNEYPSMGEAMAAAMQNNISLAADSTAEISDNGENDDEQPVNHVHGHDRCTCDSDDHTHDGGCPEAAVDRRARYSAAIEDAWYSNGFNWEGPAADAAMAVADGEIHTAVYRENDKGGEARAVVGQIRRDLGVEFEGQVWSVENMGKAVTAVRELKDENARLRAELEAQRVWAVHYKSGVTDASAHIRAELETARRNQREDRESADALLREQDAEITRLRAELEITQRVYDQVGTAYCAKEEENIRLRAELDEVTKAARGAISEAMQRHAEAMAAVCVLRRVKAWAADACDGKGVDVDDLLDILNR